jgi:transcription elongation GreA/GreB family factor
MLKEALLEAVKRLIEQRMLNSWEAMQAAQAASNQEEKSSAGDKYETARAMGQLDRDMHGRQYEQARQERQLLERLNSNPADLAGLGALVSTEASGTFYLAVSIGKVSVEGTDVMVISPQSPLGQALIGKRTNESFTFRGKTDRILAVF